MGFLRKKARRRDKIKKKAATEMVQPIEIIWRPQPDLNPAKRGMQAPAVVPHEMRDVLDTGPPRYLAIKNWRPQPDLNRCCRRER